MLFSLLATIAEKMKGYKTIYLSPDGVYNQINVQTLMPSGCSYVIDNRYPSCHDNKGHTRSSVRSSARKKMKIPPT